MNVVFASRTGNVESVVRSLGIEDAVKIRDGSENVQGEYILFTYTDGKGEVPKNVRKFLEHNPEIRGVVGSGNSEWHYETYNKAADLIARQFGVPVIARLDATGTDADHKNIRAAL